MLRLNLGVAISRLYTRLRVLPAGSDSDMKLSDVIVPVTSIDELLLLPRNLSGTADISSATGSTSYFIVGKGKKWHLRAINKPATSGNTRVRVVIGGIAFEVTANDTTNTIVTTLSFRMREGDAIQLTNTNNVGDAARTLLAYVEEEDGAI